MWRKQRRHSRLSHERSAGRDTTEEATEYRCAFWCAATVVLVSVVAFVFFAFLYGGVCNIPLLYLAPVAAGFLPLGFIVVYIREEWMGRRAGPRLGGLAAASFIIAAVIGVAAIVLHMLLSLGWLALN